MENDTWIDLASVWELLALAFAFPTEELFGLIEDGSYDETLQDLCASLGMERPDAVRRGPAENGDELDFSRLKREYSHLFVSPGMPLVPNCLSYWWTKRRGVKHLMFVNTVAVNIERLMDEFSVRCKRPNELAPDSIEAVCSFAQYLALLCAADGDGSHGGGECAAAYGQLVKDIVFEPAADFAEALCAEASLPFYRIHAELLEALCTRDLWQASCTSAL